MSSNVSVCEMSQEVIDLLKKFKLRKEKNIAAIVLKIDRASLKIVLDEEYNDISVSDLQEELPSQQPRYVCLSYVQNHSDGRVSYPLIFVFISPPGVSPELQMMYAGSKTKAVKDGDFTKMFFFRKEDDYIIHMSLGKKTLPAIAGDTSFTIINLITLLSGFKKPRHKEGRSLRELNVIELRSLEDLTEETILDKLKLFK